MTNINIILDAIAPVLESIVDSKIEKAIAKKNIPTSVLAEYVGTDSNGKQWVVYDGSDTKAPISWSTIEAAEGDRVSVTISNGRSVMDSNLSNPSAGVIGVEKAAMTAEEAKNDAVTAIQYSQQAYMAASDAQTSAESASASAAAAAIAADDAQRMAGEVHGLAEQAQVDADTAKTAADAAQIDADAAQTAADTAQSSANAATRSLSDVERVVGTVNWIAEHGQYINQAGQTFDASKVYYTRSGSGTEQDPYVYTVVPEPVAADIADYYLLSIDESVQNYVNTHLWVDSDGLHVASENTSSSTKAVRTGWNIGSVLEMVREGVSWLKLWAENNVAKLRLGRADSSHLLLDSSGLEIIQPVIGSSSNFSLAKFSDTTRIGSKNRGNYVVIDDDSFDIFHGSTQIQIAHFGYGNGNAQSGTADAPYYTLGTRTSGMDNGNFSVAEGIESGSSGYGSHAEGRSLAFGIYAHSEGLGDFGTGYVYGAIGNYSHIEGNCTKALGKESHAQNSYTVATGRAQTVLGTFNVNDAAVEDFQCLNNSTVEFELAETPTAVLSVMKASGSYGTWEKIDYTLNDNILTVTEAPAKWEHVIVEYLTSPTTHPSGDAEYGTYAVIVGNGTATNARSNALTVDWNGNVGIAGDVKDMSGNAKYLPLSGGTMTGDIEMAQHYINNAERVYARYHQLIDASNNRLGSIYISGTYLYIQGFDSSGNSLCQYRFNLTDWGIAYRVYKNDAWQSWESHIYNATASRTKNTVLAAPSTADGAATFRALSTLDLPIVSSTTATTSSTSAPYSYTFDMSAHAMYSLSMTSTVSIPNSTWTEVVRIRFTNNASSGMLYIKVRWASNTTGQRYIGHSSASSTSDLEAPTTNSAACVSYPAPALRMSYTWPSSSIAAGTYVGIYVYQNSGAALNIGQIYVRYMASAR